MVRVALITSWNDRCGISEYARHLVEGMHDPDIQLQVVAEPIGVLSNQAYLNNFDVFQLNCCGFTMQGWHPGLVDKVHGNGKKLMLTWHDSSPENNVNDFTKLFDKVVIHEPRTSDGYVYVPQGAPTYTPNGTKVQWQVGTNGIPQERKNLIELAKACELIAMPLKLWTPETHHADVNKLNRDIQAVNSNYVMYTDWLSDEAVLEGLASCAVLCYPYLEWNPGPSAATMCAVSTRRPIVVSRSAQFDHWRGREDEIYFIETTHPKAADIANVLSQALNDVNHGEARIPTKLYEEHRWDRCIDTYAQLWKGQI